MGSMSACATRGEDGGPLRGMEVDIAKGARFIVWRIVGLFSSDHECISNRAPEDIFLIYPSLPYHYVVPIQIRHIL